MPKIIKTIDVNHMAVKRSQIDMFHDGPPRLTIGLGIDKEIYAKGVYSGWAFRNSWVRVGPRGDTSISFSFEEMKEIISKLEEEVKS